MTTELDAEDFLPRFQPIVDRIVWCTMATQDRQGRLRSRIVHPIWQGATGWLATGRQTLKARHLEANPFVSLTYWDPKHEQAIIDCRAEWVDDPETRDWLWQLFKETPPPVGYDPGLFFTGGPTDPGYGALKLSPWRMEVWSLAEMGQGAPATVYRPSGA